MYGITMEEWQASIADCALVIDRLFHMKQLTDIRNNVVVRDEHTFWQTACARRKVE